MQTKGNTLLIIEKQESLAQDKFTKNGCTKELHVVAKNIPFSLHVASSVNLNEHPLHAALCYDFENESDQKEVETLKCTPLEYIAHVSDSGEKANVEIRIAVLSSQHEGANFRIKLSVKDPRTSKLVHVFTSPLKVISKRNQVKKMLERKEITHVEPLPPPKRTSSDTITEALHRLEEQQREQAKLLQQLVGQKKGLKSSSEFNFAAPAAIPDPEDMDFDAAFLKFLNTYKKIPAEERPNKVRKLLKTSPHQDSQTLSEFVNIYSCEVLAGATEQNFIQTFHSMDMPAAAGHTSEHPSDCCNCTECPHKKQLERMDDFYSEFIFDDSDPSSSPGSTN
jgi:hypothetical protein